MRPRWKGLAQHNARNFGGLMPVQEFAERRVLWVELQPRDSQHPLSPLTQLLSLRQHRTHSGVAAEAAGGLGGGPA